MRSLRAGLSAAVACEEVTVQATRSEVLLEEPGWRFTLAGHRR